jgi:PIN domain nuclease of toxin-antitoxin system
MILLDAYAVISLLEDEAAGVQVADLLRSGECAITAVNLAEAVDVVSRRRAVPVDELRAAVGPLTGTALPVVGVDERLGWRAAGLRARYYRRRDDPLSLADCFLLAAATPGSDQIVTADAPIVRAARAEGISVIVLPRSDGSVVE